jgi:hypothetical protein
MSRGILAIALTALHLAACESGESDIKAGNASSSVQAGALPTAPSGSRPSASEPRVTPEVDAGTQVQGAEIPLEYRGRWTSPSQSCDDVEEYWVYIRADRMDTYETVGTVLAVRHLDSLAVELDMNVKSEDQTWLETRVLRLSDDRQTIAGSTKPHSTRPFDLVRCEPIQETPVAPAA